MILQNGLKIMSMDATDLFKVDLQTKEVVPSGISSFYDYKDESTGETLHQRNSQLFKMKLNNSMAVDELGRLIADRRITKTALFKVRKKLATDQVVYVTFKYSTFRSTLKDDKDDKGKVKKYKVDGKTKETIRYMIYDKEDFSFKIDDIEYVRWCRSGSASRQGKCFFINKELVHSMNLFTDCGINPKKRRIIGDRKQLLVEKKLEQQKELFAKIKVGDVMEGTVKNVTDFGAFIDLGGADGLLHISEMSWGRVESPKKVFNVGDTVKVFIKDINDTKIALSMKFPSENPWNGAAEKFAVGNIVKGKVARMTDFGAFVELAPGVDALLHVSQISKDHVEKPADVLKIGQEIEAKVVDFNEDDKKISLSIKALEAPEEDAVEAAEVHTEE